MLAGLDSGVESLTAHVCIGRLRRPGELFPLLGGSAVLDMDCARSLNDSQGTMRINDSIITRCGNNLLSFDFRSHCPAVSHCSNMSACCAGVLPSHSGAAEYSGMWNRSQYFIS